MPLERPVTIADLPSRGSGIVGCFLYQMGADFAANRALSQQRAYNPLVRIT
jgi:hypothetical protein